MSYVHTAPCDVHCHHWLHFRGFNFISVCCLYTPYNLIPPYKAEKAPNLAAISVLLFAHHRNLSTILCLAKHTVDFLAEQFDQKMFYSSLHVYRSLISSTYLPCEGHPVREYPLVSRFLKGAFINCPHSQSSSSLGYRYYSTASSRPEGQWFSHAGAPHKEMGHDAGAGISQ